MITNSAYVETDSGRVCFLTLMDPATMYMATCILNSRIKRIERASSKHFSLLKVMGVDEARGWASRALPEWESDHNVLEGLNVVVGWVLLKGKVVVWVTPGTHPLRCGLQQTRPLVEESMPANGRPQCCSG